MLLMEHLTAYRMIVAVNINTTSNVLRITFDVKGASTNTGSNIIYDAIT